MNITKKKQTHREKKSVITKEERREGATQGWGVRETKLLGTRQVQGCTVPHREWSQHFVVTVNGK